MYYDDHNPYQDGKAVMDFQGNVLRGDLRSRTAIRLVREWIDHRAVELQSDWDLARAGKELNKVTPLD